MTGVQFLEHVVAHHPDLMRMVLTAYSDIDVIMRAINRCGIYQYILKPWDNRQLKITIDNALAKYQLTLQNKALIQSLREANAGLEQKIQARTSELLMKNEELVKINQVKDKLFSILSHDLKMPMASLNVLLDLLINFKDEMDADKLVDFSQKAKKYVHHLLAMLDNLLAWSLSQTGDFAVRCEPMKVDRLLSELKEVFQYIADQKGIRLIVHETNEDTAVLADQNLTRLILRNLVSNAIKFTDQGGKIEIAYRPNGTSGCLEVADTGVGIADTTLHQINAGQFSEASAGTHEEKGMGLGLRLSSEFAGLQRGTLWAESQPGSWTKFTLTLPKS